MSLEETDFSQNGGSEQYDILREKNSYSLQKKRSSFVNVTKFERKLRITTYKSSTIYRLSCNCFQTSWHDGTFDRTRNFSHDIYIFFSSLSPDRRYERISHEKFIERVNYRNNRSAESVIIPGVQLIVADSDRWVIMSLIHSSSTWLSWNSGFHSGQILSQLRDDEWFFRIVFTILIIKGVSWNLHARIKKKVTWTCLFQFFLSFFFFRCIYFWIFFFFFRF